MYLINIIDHLNIWPNKTLGIPYNNFLDIGVDVLWIYFLLLIDILSNYLEQYF